MRAQTKHRAGVGARYYSLLAVLVIVYLATIIFFKSDSATLARYNITDLQLRLLSLTIIIPAVAIWFAAFYSFVKLGNYVQKIKDTPDGKGFSMLYTGLVIYGLGLPITALLSRFISYIATRHMINQPTATIVNTHLPLVFSIVGFALLAVGARRLVSLVRKAQVPRLQTIGVAVAMGIVAIVYIVATLHNPSRQVAAQPAVNATYAMSDWLIIATIVLPYLFIWVCGSYAALWLHTYHRHIGGKIYKQTLKRLNTGFFIVILASIITQFLTNLSTGIVGWSLGAILLLVYVLLFIIAIGYLLVALGAKGLNHLEEAV